MIKTSTPAIDKSVAILDYLSDNIAGVTFTELYTNLNLPKSSTFLLIKSLLAHGLIRQQGELYFLSLRLSKWGKKAIDCFNIKEIAYPILRDLTNKTGLTSHLGVLTDNYPSYLVKVESPFAIIVNSYVGKQLPLNSTALGKVFLSYIDEKTREHLLETLGPFQKYTEKTITDIDVLRKSLDKVKEHGFAIDNEEDCEGVICLAAPVLDRNNNIVAAVSISGVLQQYAKKPIEEQVIFLKEATNKLSSMI